MLWQLLLIIHAANAFLPGVRPRAYNLGSQVLIGAQSLASPLPAQVPHPFSHLPFCDPPQTGYTNTVQTLGELLLGETLTPTAFKIRIGQEIVCEQLCRVGLDEEKRSLLKEMIDDNYNIRLIADDLPGLTSTKLSPHANLLTSGVPLGSRLRVNELALAAGQAAQEPSNSSVYVLNNAYKLRIGLTEHHHDKLWMPLPQDDPPLTKNHPFKEQYSIHDFTIESFSAGGDAGLGDALCDTSRPFQFPLVLDESLSGYNILYSVSFEYLPPSTTWMSRWDKWLSVQSRGLLINGTIETDQDKLVVESFQSATHTESLQWYSVINSCLVVVLLSTVVAAILLRTLLRDITFYNEAIQDSAAELVDESGWKLVHADAFRKPAHFTILSALVGCGAQVGAMGCGLGCLWLSGLFSSVFASRRRVLTASIVLWALSGYFAGYVSARLYGSFQRATNWRMTFIRTCVVYPGTILSLFVATNGWLVYTGSSAAQPFSTLFELGVLWLGVSSPLLLVGTFHGYKTNPPELPVKVGRIPRHVHTNRWRRIALPIVSGLLPFAAVLPDCLYMMSLATQFSAAPLLGLSTFCAVILTITAAEVAIMNTYMTLNNEDYHWWWPAFISGGSVSFFAFAYLMVHPFLMATGFAASSLKPSVLMIWLGYSAMASYTLFVFCGAVGFMSSMFFVHKMYASIKIN